jgi:hypothetical protein
MDLRSRLNILIGSGGLFTDVSAEAQDFRRDNFDVELEANDYIYVSHSKQINALYAQLETPSLNEATLKVEYFNKNAQWVELQISDGTKGFSRNGFITWQRVSDADKSAVNDVSGVWVRISQVGGSPSGEDSSAFEARFQGINLVFSEDNDIASEAPALLDDAFYPHGQTSHILQHLASKNYIMSRLRNLGYIKHTDEGIENINEWDLLDIYEIRQAATYYSIGQVYFNLSDNVEDQYWAKYQSYKKKFEQAMGLAQLRIDQNDNGVVDASEKKRIKTIRWGR